MIIVTYRDIPDDGYDKTWEIVEIDPTDAGQFIVKELIVPGMFGHKDMYIRHHIIEGICLLISYTYHEPSEGLVSELVATAVHKIEQFKTGQN